MVGGDAVEVKRGRWWPDSCSGKCCGEHVGVCGQGCEGGRVRLEGASELAANCARRDNGTRNWRELQC